MFFSIPRLDVNARMFIGKDPTDETKRMEAPAVLKINAIDPSKNSFSAKLHDTSFDKIATAFGTKKPLLRFQHEAYFLEDAKLEFEPRKEGKFKYNRLCYINKLESEIKTTPS